MQIERELPYNSSISLGFIHTRGLHIIVSRNINVPLPVSVCNPVTNPNLCRPNPNFGNISRYEGSGDSYYNGMVVSFNKRANRFAGVRVSYTYSKAIDNTGNAFFSSPQDNFNIRDDRGLSDNDQRHRLTISGTVNTPQADDGTLLHRVYGGFQFSYIYTYASSLAFNIFATAIQTLMTDQLVSDATPGADSTLHRSMRVLAVGLDLANGLD